jgi:tetratricopeptide (TPR) repeat protein
MKVAAAAICALVGVAHADVPAKARVLADRGRASHEKGDYATAVALFTEAYALAPSPALLFNLAQSYRLQGDCDTAVLMYKRYIDTDPPPEALALARAHLANVERCARHDPVPNEVIADPTPTPHLQVAAVPPHVETDGSPGGLRKEIGLGLGVGGSAALVGALWFAYQAHEASDAVEAAYKHGGKQGDVARLDADGRTDARYATALGIGGGLAVAAGAALYVLGVRAENAGAVSVHPTAHGAQVAVAWSF